MKPASRQHHSTTDTTSTTSTTAVHDRLHEGRTSTDEATTPGLGGRTPAITAAGRREEEVTSMQLSTLIDMQGELLGLGDDIPCREYDAELWFAERPDDVEFAKSLCGMCPARLACLAGALDRQEPWGVWGGQLLVHGAIVARKRPRGRPRKSDTVAA